MASGVPVAAAVAAPAPDLSATPPAASPLAAPPPPKPSTPPPTGWTARRIAAWATSVAAVVAVGAAVTYGVQAQSQSAQLKDGTVRSAADADALARGATSNAKTASALYALGGAAAGAGVTLFVLEGRF
jgi:hypothetical protein